jgi:lipoate-protein ligase A
MLFLDITRPQPAENLALDEALLAACEAGEITADVLRVWESERPLVVLGRSSQAEVEVNLAECRRLQVPVLRRTSGGGTVVAGPGCLMVAVVLSLTERPELRAVDQAHRYVLERVAAGLAPLVPSVTLQGISDLALGSGADQKKISGNALRLKRTHLLYHGTLLYDFDLALVERLLATPTRTPAYRRDRSHREFVTNLPTSREQLVAALRRIWQATKPLTDWPHERMAEIVRDKYGDNPKWRVSR